MPQPRNLSTLETLSIPTKIDLILLLVSDLKDDLVANYTEVDLEFRVNAK